MVAVAVCVVAALLLFVCCGLTTFHDVFVLSALTAAVVEACMKLFVVVLG